MTDPFDIDAFEERAAIAEFDGGQTRFQAETMAAQAQGVTRWQALKSIKDATDANGCGDTQRSGNFSSEMVGRQCSQHMPAVQLSSEKENRSVPEYNPQVGRNSLVLSALRTQGRPAV